MTSHASAGAFEGFSPETWGPGVWFLLHTMAAAFPENPTADDRRKHMAFLVSLPNVLPCAACRNGMASLVSAGPLKLTSAVLKDRFSFFRWTVDFHNAVNAKVGHRVVKDWVFWYKHYSQYR